MDPKSGTEMENSSEANLAELLKLRKEVSADGYIQYYNKDDQLHRINGPAVISPNGNEEWWINGELHKEDGPAVKYSSGTLAWFQNGLKHRIGGPAIIWSDGIKEWWEYGQQLRRDRS